MYLEQLSSWLVIHSYFYEVSSSYFVGADVSVIAAFESVTAAFMIGSFSSPNFGLTKISGILINGVFASGPVVNMTVGEAEIDASEVNCNEALTMTFAVY
jgi:hypothetical protein